ncbi:MAG: amidohydrolase family protein [Myxococcota bacterium]
MADARVVLSNAQLIDGVGDPKSGAHLVIEGNTITAAGAGDAETRPDDRVVDLAGKTVMSGLVQGHFHSGFGPYPTLGAAPILGLEAAPPYMGMVAAKNAQIALQTGTTGIIGSSCGDNLDVCLREAMIMGLVQGPRIIACGHEFMASGDMADGMNRSWFMGIQHSGLTRRLDGAEEFRQATREEIGRGCEIIKLSIAPGHGSSPVRDVCYLSREELEAVVGVAHDHGKLVRAHCPSRIGILECARAGVDIIDHADRIDDECIEAVVKSGAAITPSLLWSTRFLQFAENWDYANGPFPIGEGFAETHDQVLARLRGVREDFEYTCEQLPKMMEAGVSLVCGDDFGFAMMPHGDYVSEYEVYTKQMNLPALEVLRWASVNGAKVMAGPLGLDAGHGTLVAGQRADLIVVDGDPVADISCLRDRIVGIVRDGEFIRDAIG